MEKPESINRESDWLPAIEESNTYEPYNMQDEMVDSDGISPEPDIKEEISRLIKEEPLNEEICLKEDPDDAGAVKIEQDVTVMIVPKVERIMSPSESYEDFGRDINKGAKNVFDDITGFLKNDAHCVKTEESALHSQQSEEGQLHSPSRCSLSDKIQESSSSACEEVTTECEILDVMSPSYIEKYCLCNDCGKTFTTHNVLKNHQKVHSGERSNNLGISPASSTRKSVQQRQENVHFGGQVVFACYKCNRSFSSFIGLQIHRAYCVKVSKSCCCDELGIPCSFESNNRNHKRHLQSTNLPCCCSCGKNFQLKKTLMNHVVSHLDERPYNCAECRRGFKRRIDLIRHLLIHNNVKSYTCDKCFRDFRRKNDLKLHMLTHSEDRPFNCNECGKGFKTRQVLVDHLAIHNKSRSFTCISCSKGFRTRRSLYDHITFSHSNEKQYTCNECSRRFKFRKALIRHMENHNEMKAGGNLIAEALPSKVLDDSQFSQFRTCSW